MLKLKTKKMAFQSVITGIEIMQALNNENCISGNHASIYYQFEDKLIRFSDHLPKMYNLCQNENVNEMMFVFDDVELSQKQLQDFEDEIYKEFPHITDLQIYVIESEEDKEFVQLMVKRFINS